MLGATFLWVQPASAAGRLFFSPGRPDAFDRWFAGATPVELTGYGLVALAFLALLTLTPSPIDRALRRAKPLRSDRFKRGSGLARVDGTLEATEVVPAPITGRPCVLWDLVLIAAPDGVGRTRRAFWRQRDLHVASHQRWWAEGLSVADVDGPVLLDLDAPRLFVPGSTQVLAAQAEHLEVLLRYLPPEQADRVVEIREQAVAPGTRVAVAGLATRIDGAPSLGGHDLVISGDPRAVARRPWAPWLIAGLAVAWLACIFVGALTRPGPPEATPSGRLKTFEK
jgi:hypothetical protein